MQENEVKQINTFPQNITDSVPSITNQYQVTESDEEGIEIAGETGTSAKENEEEIIESSSKVPQTFIMESKIVNTVPTAISIPTILPDESSLESTTQYKTIPEVHLNSNKPINLEKTYSGNVDTVHSISNINSDTAAVINGGVTNFEYESNLGRTTNIDRYNIYLNQAPKEINTADVFETTSDIIIPTEEIYHVFSPEDDTNAASIFNVQEKVEQNDEDINEENIPMNSNVKQLNEYDSNSSPYNDPQRTLSESVLLTKKEEEKYDVQKEGVSTEPSLTSSNSDISNNSTYLNDNINDNNNKFISSTENFDPNIFKFNDSFKNDNNDTTLISNVGIINDTKEEIVENISTQDARPTNEMSYNNDQNIETTTYTNDSEIELANKTPNELNINYTTTTQGTHSLFLNNNFATTDVIKKETVDSNEKVTNYEQVGDIDLNNSNVNTSQTTTDLTVDTKTFQSTSFLPNSEPRAHPFNNNDKYINKGQSEFISQSKSFGINNDNNKEYNQFKLITTSPKNIIEQDTTTKTNSLNYNGYKFGSHFTSDVNQGKKGKNVYRFGFGLAYTTESSNSEKNRNYTEQKKLPISSVNVNNTNSNVQNRNSATPILSNISSTNHKDQLPTSKLNLGETQLKIINKDFDAPKIKTIPKSQPEFARDFSTTERKIVEINQSSLSKNLHTNKNLAQHHLKTQPSAFPKNRKVVKIIQNEEPPRKINNPINNVKIHQNVPVQKGIEIGNFEVDESKGFNLGFLDYGIPKSKLDQLEVIINNESHERNVEQKPNGNDDFIKRNQEYVQRVPSSNTFTRKYNIPGLLFHDTSIGRYI